MSLCDELKSEWIRPIPIGIGGSISISQGISVSLQHHLSNIFQVAVVASTTTIVVHFQRNHALCEESQCKSKEQHEVFKTLDCHE